MWIDCKWPTAALAVINLGVGTKCRVWTLNLRSASRAGVKIVRMAGVVRKHHFVHSTASFCIILHHRSNHRAPSGTIGRSVVAQMRGKAISDMSWMHARRLVHLGYKSTNSSADKAVIAVQTNEGGNTADSQRRQRRYSAIFVTGLPVAAQSVDQKETRASTHRSCCVWSFMQAVISSARNGEAAHGLCDPPSSATCPT